MQVNIRAATHKDCDYLAENLRFADLLELAASTGRNPHEALHDSLARSKASWVADVNGEPSVIFGVGTSPLDPEVGVPWLLASDNINSIPVHFLRKSRSYIELMQSWYPYLTNIVDKRHEASKSWLEWCGFIPANEYQEFGAGKKPFIRYVRVRGDHNV